MKSALIVDDDPLWRSILSREVESAGMQAEPLSSWSEALALLKRHSRAYSLLVTDLFEGPQPWSEGLRLLRELRSSGIQIPVIAVSGDDKVDVKLIRELFHEHKIFDFFRKDVDTGAFRRSVEKVLDSGDEALLRVRRICEQFHSVVTALSNRREQRPTLTISDEYDVQDLLRSLFTIDFGDVRPEEPVPSLAGTSSRADFLLRQEKIAVEAKKTRKNLGHKEVVDQLMIDIGKYRAHPDFEVLVCFVYDPDGMIRNVAGVEAGLAQLSVPKLKVVPIISPQSR